MADFSPPPLIPATDTESYVADSGGVIVIHGKTPRPGRIQKSSLISA